MLPPKLHVPSMGKPERKYNTPKWSIKDLSGFYDISAQALMSRAKNHPLPDAAIFTIKGKSNAICNMYEKQELINWYLSWEPKN